MKEYPKAWIEALRSGKYKQTTRLLKDSKGGMCCLGVLCEISDSSRWHNHQWGGEATDALPKELRDGLGFKSRSGDIRLPFSAESLTSLNDSGLTFSQIADVIECFWTEL